MNKLKFTYNKAYNYVTNTHPLKMILDAFLAGLATIAASGLLMVCYHIMFNSPTITFGGW